MASKEGEDGFEAPEQQGGAICSAVVTVTVAVIVAVCGRMRPLLFLDVVGICIPRRNKS